MTDGNINGILNVLKPPGMTSFDVVANLRRILKVRKIGHTGTLDPGAVGVLPVCIGNATKAIEFMTEKDKVYRAELKLGISTDTQDITGEVIETKDINVTREQIRDAVMSFVGDYSQIPPMYSAIKINGQKLYDLARSSITIEREPRNVKIYYINIIDISEDGSVLFDVACSKGTYIRTLCEDIGNMLGCGACLSCLVRTSSGPFKIENSFTLEEIQDAVLNGKLDDVLLPVDRFLEKMPKVNLAVDKEGFFSKGKMINGDFQFLNDIDTLVRVYNNKEFLGIAKVVKDKDSILLQVLKSLK